MASSAGSEGQSCIKDALRDSALNCVNWGGGGGVVAAQHLCACVLDSHAKVSKLHQKVNMMKNPGVSW
jgi:hypothetical protein